MHLSNIPYDEKVDVFSYGLLLFYLMTSGHRAFEELTGTFEMDRAVEEVGVGEHVTVHCVGWASKIDWRIFTPHPLCRDTPFLIFSSLAAHRGQTCRS